MNKLIISDFGPIKNVELEVKDFCAFIGPQASGKSTIAKLLYLVWLMVLFANQKGNRLIVTTHSPYILTSVNNLLYAEQVAGVAGVEPVEKIIPSPYWLDFNRLSVNMIGEGEITSVLDDSICQVKAEMIDSVSGILNEQYEQLLDLDIVGEEAC